MIVFDPTRFLVDYRNREGSTRLSWEPAAEGVRLSCLLYDGQGEVDYLSFRPIALRVLEQALARLQADGACSIHSFDGFERFEIRTGEVEGTYDVKLKVGSKSIEVWGVPCAFNLTGTFNADHHVMAGAPTNAQGPQ